MPDRHVRNVPIPQVVAALCVIAVLALVLPYAIVRALHHRRLETADRHLHAMASTLAASLPRATMIPAGTQLLAGRGPRPAVQDDLWTTASAFPLARMAADPGPDPWGNAYLVNLRDRADAWVISAGPDGILQTPLTAAAPQASGDDRVVPIR